MSQHSFQTEVSQLLNLIIHSLYSHKEIFLRELISNSSDALDKLRYLTLTNDAFKSLNFEPKVSMEFVDGDNPTLTIADTGIGMSKKELEDNLGTIARSGTKNFLSKMSGDAQKDAQLIGQFGVGFYSSFMVADHVEVVSLKAGNKEAWKWSSDGKSGFEIVKDVKKNNGTVITLYLNDEGKEFANRWQIENLVKKYSDHIDFPIFLTYPDIEYDDEGKEKNRSSKTDQINDAKAFWTRSPKEVKKKEYNKWYIAYECENEEEKHYFWVADKIISENADTPLQIGLSLFGSLLGTSVANNSSSFEDASDEIIPLIEERKKIISSSKEVLPDPAEACASLLGCGILGILFATTVLYY